MLFIFYLKSKHIYYKKYLYLFPKTSKMAKNKRNKIVTLSKTKKKGEIIDRKTLFIEKVKQLAADYNYIFTLTFKNMTTYAFQSLRAYWREEEGEFLMGKTSLMKIALGKNEDETLYADTYKLNQCLKGNSCMFFTNKEPESVVK